MSRRFGLLDGGYSVQVNDAKLLTYQQLFEQYNLDYHEYSRLDEYGNVESNYVYDIELNISNTDNTTGYIFFGRYLLVDKSLTLFYNSTIQALVYPELADVGSLKLKPGANKTLHFFFTPSTREDAYGRCFFTLRFRISCSSANKNQVIASSDTERYVFL